MDVSEVWFLMGIGGFLLFLEGIAIWLATPIGKLFRRDISDATAKIIVGITIAALAIAAKQFDII